MDAGFKYILSKFIDAAKLEEMLIPSRVEKSYRENFDKWKGCTFTTHSKFNKSKFRLLYLEWGNPGWGTRGWRAATATGWVEGLSLFALRYAASPPVLGAGWVP